MLTKHWTNNFSKKRLWLLYSHHKLRLICDINFKWLAWACFKAACFNQNNLVGLEIFMGYPTTICNSKRLNKHTFPKETIGLGMTLVPMGISLSHLPPITMDYSKVRPSPVPKYVPRDHSFFRKFSHMILGWTYFMWFFGLLGKNQSLFSDSGLLLALNSHFSKMSAWITK